MYYVQCMHAHSTYAQIANKKLRTQAIVSECRAKNYRILSNALFIEVVIFCNAILCSELLMIFPGAKKLQQIVTRAQKSQQ